MGAELNRTSLSSSFQLNLDSGSRSLSDWRMTPGSGVGGGYVSCDSPASSSKEQETPLDDDGSGQLPGASSSNEEEEDEGLNRGKELDSSSESGSDGSVFTEKVEVTTIPTTKQCLRMTVSSCDSGDMNESSALQGPSPSSSPPPCSGTDGSGWSQRRESEGYHSVQGYVKFQFPLESVYQNISSDISNVKFQF